MRPELWLRWGAPWLALIAVFLPALTASAPLLPPRHWSALDVCRAATKITPSKSTDSQDQKPSLRDLLQHIEDIRRQLANRQGGGVPIAFKLAALVPVTLVLAAAAAVLLVAFSILRWWRMCNVAAALGCAAAAYTTVVAFLLTRAVQQELAVSLDEARHSFHFHALAELGARFAAQIGLHPEAALYLMLLAFVSVLIVPKPASKIRANA